MPAERPEDALAAVLKRIDRTSADSLIQSIAGEIVRLQSANAVLEARLAAMESLNALADRLLSEPSSAPQPVYASRVEIDAASAFLDAVGFHALELDPNGAPFRWSGPQRQFSFHLFVDRSRAAAFTLSFDGLYAEGPVEGLRGFVDGEEIALSFARAERVEARGELPIRREGGGTTLTFLAPRLASPGDRGLNDRRQLGVCFRRLAIAPATTG
jgi:hypothetical protein